MLHPSLLIVLPRCDTCSRAGGFKTQLQITGLWPGRGRALLAYLTFPRVLAASPGWGGGVGSHHLRPPPVLKALQQLDGGDVYSNTC